MALVVFEKEEPLLQTLCCRGSGDLGEGSEPAQKKSEMRFTPLLIGSSFGERLAICSRFPVAAIRFY
jgi:hypothetical protein